MSSYFNRFLLCLLLVFPSWLAGAIQHMANGSDLLVTAGFAAVLAWVLGLRNAEAVGPCARQLPAATCGPYGSARATISAS